MGKKRRPGVEGPAAKKVPQTPGGVEPSPKDDPSRASSDGVNASPSAAREKDQGFNESHGYPTGHGGPTSPGDAPAKGSADAHDPVQRRPQADSHPDDR